MQHVQKTGTYDDLATNSDRNFWALIFLDLHHDASVLLYLRKVELSVTFSNIIGTKIMFDEVHLSIYL